MYRNVTIQMSHFFSIPDAGGPQGWLISGSIGILPLDKWKFLQREVVDIQTFVEGLVCILCMESVRDLAQAEGFLFISFFCLLMFNLLLLLCAWFKEWSRLCFLPPLSPLPCTIVWQETAWLHAKPFGVKLARSSTSFIEILDEILSYLQCFFWLAGGMCAAHV